MGLSSESQPTCVIDMSAEQARRFFLKEESYRGFDLPPYFRFSGLLNEVSEYLEGKNLSDCIGKKKPADCEGVNYLLLANKDGRHAWRPFELIHPALYVGLVNIITSDENWKAIKKRFHDFYKIEKMDCMSLPVEAPEGEKDKESQILNWWSGVEQKSIELALDYEAIVHADITDCYGQVYTHSISWALHTKRKAKERRRDKSLIGNIIDKHIQDMRHGQTNGIPQGSVLMDFVAEMVLGYVDENLLEKINQLNVRDYRILRYRDDYRIFVHSTHDGEKILKALTEALIDFGFKLNSAKTVVSQNVIASSIKKDKIDWMARKQTDNDLQKHLLIIHDHSMRHPNAGSLLRGLSDFRKRLDRVQKIRFPEVLISVIVDIAYHNPRTYPICAAILSRLFQFIKDRGQKERLLKKIVDKFSSLPNTEYMSVWLQRIAISLRFNMDFEGSLCDLCKGEEVDNGKIWNCNWIDSTELKNIIEKSIFDEDVADDLDEIIAAKEVELFVNEYSL